MSVTWTNRYMDCGSEYTELGFGILKMIMIEAIPDEKFDLHPSSMYCPDFMLRIRYPELEKIYPGMRGRDFLAAKKRMEDMKK